MSDQDTDKAWAGFGKAIVMLGKLPLGTIVSIWGAHFESAVWMRWIRPISTALPPVTTIQFALIGVLVSMVRPRNLADVEAAKYWENLILVGVILPPLGWAMCWFLSVFYGWF